MFSTTLVISLTIQLTLSYPSAKHAIPRRVYPREVGKLNIRNGNLYPVTPSIINLEEMVKEVEELIKSNSSFPRLTRGEIIDLVENISKSELKALMKDRDQKSVMLVMPYSAKNSGPTQIEDLYTKPPITKIVHDSEIPSSEISSIYKRRRRPATKPPENDFALDNTYPYGPPEQNYLKRLPSSREEAELQSYYSNLLEQPGAPHYTAVKRVKVPATRVVSNRETLSDPTRQTLDLNPNYVAVKRVKSGVRRAPVQGPLQGGTSVIRRRVPVVETKKEVSEVKPNYVTVRRVKVSGPRRAPVYSTTTEHYQSSPEYHNNAAAQVLPQIPEQIHQQYPPPAPHQNLPNYSSKLPDESLPKYPPQTLSQSHSQYPSQMHEQINLKYPPQTLSQSHSQYPSQTSEQNHPKYPPQTPSQSHSQYPSQIAEQNHPKYSHQTPPQSHSQYPSQLPEQNHPKYLPQTPTQSHSQYPSQLPEQYHPKYLPQTPTQSHSQYPSQIPEQNHLKYPLQAPIQSHLHYLSQIPEQSHSKHPSQSQAQSLSQYPSQIFDQNHIKYTQQIPEQSNFKYSPKTAEPSYTKYPSQTPEQKYHQYLPQTIDQSFSKLPLQISEQSQPKYPPQISEQSYLKYPHQIPEQSNSNFSPQLQSQSNSNYSPEIPEQSFQSHPYYTNTMNQNFYNGIDLELAGSSKVEQISKENIKPTAKVSHGQNSDELKQRVVIPVEEEDDFDSVFSPNTRPGLEDLTNYGRSHNLNSKPEVNKISENDSGKPHEKTLEGHFEKSRSEILKAQIIKAYKKEEALMNLKKNTADSEAAVESPIENPEDEIFEDEVFEDVLPLKNKKVTVVSSTAVSSTNPSTTTTAATTTAAATTTTKKNAESKKKYSARQNLRIRVSTPKLSTVVVTSKPSTAITSKSRIVSKNINNYSAKVKRGDTRRSDPDIDENNKTSPVVVDFLTTTTKSIELDENVVQESKHVKKGGVSWESLVENLSKHDFNAESAQSINSLDSVSNKVTYVTPVTIETSSKKSTTFRPEIITFKSFVEEFSTPKPIKGRPVYKPSTSTDISVVSNSEVKSNIVKKRKRTTPNLLSISSTPPPALSSTPSPPPSPSPSPPSTSESPPSIFTQSNQFFEKFESNLVNNGIRIITPPNLNTEKTGIYNYLERTTKPYEEMGFFPSISSARPFELTQVTPASLFSNINIPDHLRHTLKLLNVEDNMHKIPNEVNEDLVVPSPAPAPSVEFQTLPSMTDDLKNIMDSFAIYSSPKTTTTTTTAMPDLSKVANNLGSDMQELLMSFGLLPNPNFVDSPAAEDETDLGAEVAETDPDSYFKFKPLPESGPVNNDMEEFLSRFGLGGNMRSSKHLQSNRDLKDQKLTKIPFIDLSGIPDSLKDTIRDIGLIDDRKKITAEHIINVLGKSDKQNEDNLAGKHTFKPTGIPIASKEELKKLQNLLVIIKQLDRLNKTIGTSQQTDEDIESLANLVGTFKNQFTPLNEQNWAPNPLNEDVDLIKNEVKRQENSTVSSTESEMEVTVITEAPNIKGLEESFGGSDGPAQTVTIPPPTSSTPNTGFYYLVDWNSFLDIDDQKGKRVNLRLQPKVGDPSKFLSVSVP